LKRACYKKKRGNFAKQEVPKMESVVQRNIDVRKAQLGIEFADLERATGMHKQHVHRAKVNPGKSNMRTMQRIAMWLYVPVGKLLNDDVAAVVSCPLPPADFVQRLERHRETLGFDGGVIPEWEEFVKIINEQ